jgi:GTPase
MLAFVVPGSGRFCKKGLLVHTEDQTLPPDHRSGFVAVIGRPNVGKSTLLNRLLGQKIAITSPKPQTTRDPLMGILTQEDAQIMFLDTPGIHRPQHKLGKYMMEVATESVQEADVVLWVVDALVAPTAEEEAIAALLEEVLRRKGNAPSLVLGFNKLDQQPGGMLPPERLDEYKALLGWVGELNGTLDLVTFSAMTGARLDDLLGALHTRLPVGPRYYPEDQVTDAQTRFIVAELIREKALLLLQQEIPHSLAVLVDEYTERSENLTYIAAIIYVERDSQKGIVLGQGGNMIKRIGAAARPEIEELVGNKVYLDLWVKVWEKWRRREGMLRRLGYATHR